ncbi:hypothetical protein PC118_g12019 [Phytophthora cactorum]|uniref:Uncharacterized protein n=1 Tax=Phytophthora cactorum TaxID=29920 RepID=A0A8T1FTE2_9STRA|nr:hypothetical protein PC118_g12019 [Phytophthora cactorum]
MMPAETHAELAAGQCDVVGRNKGSERVLLVQFYRLLAKTTKKLVKLDSKPRTLEEAVDKAADIDDPMGNVAQGMVNIGQLWATAPSRRDTHARNGADRCDTRCQKHDEKKVASAVVNVTRCGATRKDELLDSVQWQMKNETLKETKDVLQDAYPQ